MWAHTAAATATDAAWVIYAAGWQVHATAATATDAVRHAAWPSAIDGDFGRDGEPARNANSRTDAVSDSVSVSNGDLKK